MLLHQIEALVDAGVTQVCSLNDRKLEYLWSIQN